MTAVSVADSSLATQCLDFCQALARQGKDFKLSITIGSTFSFSLDTKEGKATLPTKIQKKKSPSTLKRNAKRREDFLAKKSTVVTGFETNQNQCEAFPCDQCDSRFKTANGLKIHKGKAHKEVLRKHTEGSVSLSASPLLDTSREEFSFSSTPGEEKEDPATSPQPPPPPTRPCTGCWIKDPCPYQCGYQPPPTPPRPVYLGKELEEVCRSCNTKLYTDMCCAEEEEVCDDCCPAVCDCKKARRTHTTPVATK